MKGRLAGRLVRGETCLVSAIIDRLVNTAIQRVNLRSKALISRVRIDALFMGKATAQRGCVLIHHSYNLGALVGNDGLAVLVIKHRHRALL